MFRSIAILLVFLIVGMFVFNTTTDSNQIQGTISLEEGVTAPQAEVKLYDKTTGELVLAESTDSFGEFQFKDLTPGTYLLESSYTGYSTDKKLVMIKAGSRINLGNIDLDYRYTGQNMMAFPDAEELSS